MEYVGLIFIIGFALWAISIILSILAETDMFRTTMLEK